MQPADDYKKNLTEVQLAESHLTVSVSAYLTCMYIF